ncbi:structural maintenance of chromosomes protein 2-like isoform X2 [Hylobates moloch]|uniref:structural maintenance of chromosomes protein 2-like isoform X2 n=1 Tax=Hylobates moloch TaxID=81572 RepID=UPI002675D5C0|nr:structural maintenance of chromosomes protein 2-like isoform X2 [Hylobates moloch]
MICPPRPPKVLGLQVVIGGRNKYLINGVNTNTTRVQDLFCSVGLNVNNPHFLIMQILSMIEEAAGTRMYEYKKIAAQKTIEKKEAKLKEIKTILEEEITPTIQKLKEERSSYLEYQKVMREIEHLSRLHIAYQFLLAEDTKVRSAEELKEMQDKVIKLQEELSENDKKIKALNHEIEELEKRKDKEIGGILRSLEDALAEAQRVNTKSQSAFDLKKKNLACEESKRKELEKNIVEVSELNVPLVPLVDKYIVSLVYIYLFHEYLVSVFYKLSTVVWAGVITGPNGQKSLPCGPSFHWGK